MSKYSEFERNTLDFYPTPKSAVLPLVKHLREHYTSYHDDKFLYFIEPMAGDYRLAQHLIDEGFQCACAFDINPVRNEDPSHPANRIRELDVLTNASDGQLHNGRNEFEGAVKTTKSLFDRNVNIITNPPYLNTKASGYQLFSLIHQFRQLAPTWLLLEADFAQNKYSWVGRDGKEGVMHYCSDIIPIGRVKWIEDSKDTGKVNSAWFKFNADPCDTILRPRY